MRIRDDRCLVVLEPSGAACLAKADRRRLSPACAGV